MSNFGFNFDSIASVTVGINPSAPVKKSVRVFDDLNSNFVGFSTTVSLDCFDLSVTFSLGSSTRLTGITFSFKLFSKVVKPGSISTFIF